MKCAPLHATTTKQLILNLAMRVMARRAKRTSRTDSYLGLAGWLCDVYILEASHIRTAHMFACITFHAHNKSLWDFTSLLLSNSCLYRGEIMLVGHHMRFAALIYDSAHSITVYCVVRLRFLISQHCDFMWWGEVCLRPVTERLQRNKLNISHK